MKGEIHLGDLKDMQLIVYKWMDGKETTEINIQTNEGFLYLSFNSDITGEIAKALFTKKHEGGGFR